MCLYSSLMLPVDKQRKKKKNNNNMAVEWDAHSYACIDYRSRLKTIIVEGHVIIVLYVYY